MTKNGVSTVWVQNQVIMCWFLNFVSFRANWLKLLIVIFISRIDGKQQQNDRNLCAKDLGQKCSYLRLVSIFGSFSCLGSCAFVLENSKSSFKKNIDMWNNFFSKILQFTICIFYSFIIFEILFSISSICTCQKIIEIFMFYFILCITDFIIEFWKNMEYFSKKYRHLKSKIRHKFYRLLFFLSILVIFFTYFTYQTTRKILFFEFSCLLT